MTPATPVGKGPGTPPAASAESDVSSLTTEALRIHDATHLVLFRGVGTNTDVASIRTHASLLSWTSDSAASSVNDVALQVLHSDTDTASITSIFTEKGADETATG